MLVKKSLIKNDYLIKTRSFNPGIWHADDFGTLSVYAYGSGGFVSSKQRMDDDNIPLPERRLKDKVARRLAAAMNSFEGMATQDVSQQFLQHLSEAVRNVSSLQEEFGEAAATDLLEVEHSFFGQNIVEELHAFDASKHIEDRAFPYDYALCTNPDRPAETSLSEQTYTKADAKRLAASWNATRNVNLPVLEMGWIRQALDLVGYVAGHGDHKIQSSAYEKMRENPFRVKDADYARSRMIAETIVFVANTIEMSRLDSGLYREAKAPNHEVENDGGMNP